MGNSFRTITLILSFAFFAFGAGTFVKGPVRSDAYPNVTSTTKAVVLKGDTLAAIPVDSLKGQKGDTGPQGPKGDDGTSVRILGTFTNSSQLPTSGNTAGDGYLIAGDLWVWSGSAWSNVGTIQGPQGEQGPQGIQGIQGIQGATGATGPQGATGPNTVSTTTSTDINGLLKGNGSTISSAIVGTDYQAPITGAASTVTNSNLTANRAVVSDASGKISASTTTGTEIGYVAGLRSSAQTQIDTKVTSNTAITGSTKCKITYDSKGLVTTGTDLTLADIPLITTNKISDLYFFNSFQNYYNKISSDSLLNLKLNLHGKADSSTIADSVKKLLSISKINGLQTALDTKLNLHGKADSSVIADTVKKSLAISKITNLQTELDNKVNTSDSRLTDSRTTPQYLTRGTGLTGGNANFNGLAATTWSIDPLYNGFTYYYTKYDLGLYGGAIVSWGNIADAPTFALSSHALTSHSDFATYINQQLLTTSNVTHNNLNLSNRLYFGDSLQAIVQKFTITNTGYWYLNSSAPTANHLSTNCLFYNDQWHSQNAGTGAFLSINSNGVLALYKNTSATGSRQVVNAGDAGIYNVALQDTSVSFKKVTTNKLNVGTAYSFELGASTTASINLSDKQSRINITKSGGQACHVRFTGASEGDLYFVKCQDATVYLRYDWDYGTSSAIEGYLTRYCLVCKGTDPQGYPIFDLFN